MSEQINLEHFVDFMLDNWILYASDSKKGKRLFYKSLGDTKFRVVHNGIVHDFKSIHSAVKKYNEI